jgi:hypothetical protein
MLTRSSHVCDSLDQSQKQKTIQFLNQIVTEYKLLMVYHLVSGSSSRDRFKLTSKWDKSEIFIV